jgi:seryl-tRNA synthetase
VTVPLELKVDQRVNVSTADLQKQFDLAIKIRDEITDIHDTVREIREARTQLHALGRRLEEDARYKPIVAASQDLDKKMTPVEEELIQVNAKSSEAMLNFPVLIDERMHSLESSLDGADAAPTQQQFQVFQELSGQAAPLLAQWKRMMSTNLVALNDLMRKENVPVIYLAPEGNEARGTKAAGENLNP